MSLSDTSLYYPFINIPEPTLVHSLLFKDRIKRIVPPHTEMDAYHARQATLPNDICRQYLGYEFIENAEYWEAREEIAEMFCAFLDEAHSTQNPEHFEPLLGPDYQNRLIFTPSTYTDRTQYFVYAHKFDRRVFDKLDSLNWMRFHEQKNACEMRDELCTLYMTLIASCISKCTGDPVSTGVKQAEDLLGQLCFLNALRAQFPLRCGARIIAMSSASI